MFLLSLYLGAKSTFKLCVNLYNKTNMRVYNAIYGGIFDNWAMYDINVLLYLWYVSPINTLHGVTSIYITQSDSYTKFEF